MMNDQAQTLMRDVLERELLECTDAEQQILKKMYSSNNLTASINEIVKNMSGDKLPWALKQVARIHKNKYYIQYFDSDFTPQNGAD